MSAELVGPAPCTALSSCFHLKTRGHSPTLPKELLLLVDSMQMAARNAAALYLTMVDLTGSINLRGRWKGRYACFDIEKNAMTVLLCG